MIAIIDADLLGKKIKRFPNLACMKLSSFEKSKGNAVELKMDYKNLSAYEKVYISKVFTNTPVPTEVLTLKNVTFGGTGFYFDKSPPLPYGIEHIMPDYGLYDDYVQSVLADGGNLTALKAFQEYSIGFLTRGCFRQCSFCVNRNIKRCEKHSLVSEFFDDTRKKLMFCDDNFLACKEWQDILEDVISLNRKITFKQGLDIRLMGKEFMGYLKDVKYDGDVLSAFDDFDDAELIEKKLSLFREYSKKPMRMYVLCGFDKRNIYDTEFWLNDIERVFKRLEILSKYNVIPYLARYEKYKESPFKRFYNALASYCNQPSFYKAMDFYSYCIVDNQRRKGDKMASSLSWCLKLMSLYPNYKKYFQKVYWNKNSKEEKI